MTDRSDLNPESPDDQPIEDNQNEKAAGDENAEGRPTPSDAAENATEPTQDDSESASEAEMYSVDADASPSDSDDESEGEDVRATLSTMKWDAEDDEIQRTLDELAIAGSGTGETEESKIDDAATQDADESATRRDAIVRSGVPREIMSTLDELPRGSRDSISVIPHAAVVALSKLSESAVQAMVSQPQTAMKALADLPTKALRALAELTPKSLNAITSLPQDVIQAVIAAHDDLGATLTDISPDTFATLAELPQTEVGTIADVPSQVLSQLQDASPEAFQTLAELPQELITTLSELPQNVIQMLCGMSPDILRTVAEVVSVDTDDPQKTLAELPEAQRKTLQDVPADGLQTLAEFPQEVLQTLAELPAGALSTLEQLPDELRKSLSHFPRNFFKTLGEFSPESLRQLADVPPKSIDTVAELPAEVLKTLASVPQEAITTIEQIPEDVVEPLTQLPQEHVESIAAIPRDALQMFATLPQEAFASLSEVKSDDLKVLAEIAPKTISALAALNAPQYEALGGLISDSFDSMGLDSNKAAGAGSSLKPLGLSDSQESDGEVDWEDDSIERTIESDEFTDSDLAEFESSADWSDDGTGAETSDSADITDSSISETRISDSWSDAGRDDDEAATVESVELQDDGIGKTIQDDSPEADDDSFSETVQSDEFDDASISATLKSDAAEDDSHAQTLDSGAEDADDVLETREDDGLPPDVVKTMQTMWQEAKGQKHTGKTIKGEELLKRKEFDTGQVIKQKSVVLPGELEGVLAKVAAEEAEYVIEKKLGEGGMGFVWIAKQQSIGREVAFKTLKGKAIRQKEQRGKFLAEALVTGELAHPNIVPIYDVGKYKDDELFYAMKKVEGTEWLEVIKEKSINENLSILLKVADGIAFAHDRGVIHRDLKPENIMLGGYGEVLVMDWGLAFPTKAFKKAGSMGGSVSMGGTPAYMSPEMATGPIEKIDKHSDVYLMGAILFEIITTKPPHTGKNAMKCLMNAARNEFRKYDKEKYDGELMDIAMKAMATDTEERYQTAQEFQDAIREYLSHSESVDMSNSADKDLNQGRDSKDYNDFNQAIYGFKGALDKWDGNERARTGLMETRVAYADAALANNDFDLGLGQLTEARVDDGYIDFKMKEKKSATEPAEAKKKRKKTAKTDAPENESETTYGRIDTIYVNLESEKEERDNRVKRLQLAKRAGMIAAAVFLITVSGLSYWALDEAAKAEKQQALAVKEAANAKVQELAAVESANIAKEQEAIAKSEGEKATKEADNARIAGEKATKEADNARIAQAKATVEAKNAREANRLSQYRGYISGIGLADAKIKENSFDSARQILRTFIPTPTVDENGKRQYSEDLRDWEWGRLWHLCVQERIHYPTKGQINAIAMDTSGSSCFVGGDGGLIEVWDITNASKELEEKPELNQLDTKNQGEVTSKAKAKKLPGLDPSITVYSIAVSPKGKWVAAGTDDPKGYVKLWEKTDGKFVLDPQPLFPRESGEPDATVYSVEFSKYALTPSTSQPNSKADTHWLLTGSADGTARFWGVQSKTALTTDPLHSHTSAIWDASFSPDGTKIVTAGGDARVIVWEIQTPKINPASKLVERDQVSNRVVLEYVWNKATPENPRIYISDKVKERLRIARLLSSLQGQENRTQSNKSLKQLMKELKKKEDGDKDNQQLGGPFTEHTGPVYSAVFLDDDHVASAGDDRRVLIWKPDDVEPSNYDNLEPRLSGFDPNAEVKSETKVVELEPHLQSIRSLDIWTDSTVDSEKSETGTDDSLQMRYLVSSSDDNTIKLWNIQVKNDKPVATLENTFRGHSSFVRACAMSPDGNWVLSGSYDESFRQWHRKRYQEQEKTDIKISEFQGQHSGAVLSAVFARDKDGKEFVLTASDDRTAISWNLREEKFREFREGHEFLATNAVFFPGGKTMTTAAVDNTTRVWDVRKGTEIRKLDNTGRSAAIAISADVSNVNWILTGGEGKLGKAQLWNVDSVLDQSAVTPKVISLDKQHKAEVTAVAISEKSHVAFTGDALGQCFLWDLRGIDNDNLDYEKAIPSHALRIGNLGRLPYDKVTGAIFVKSGERLLTSFNDGSVMQWDVKTIGSPKALPKMTLGHPDIVLGLSRSADGKLVATSCEDKKIRIWDIENPRVDTKNRQIASKEFTASGGIATFDDNVRRQINLLFASTVRDRKLKAFDKLLEDIKEKLDKRKDKTQLKFEELMGQEAAMQEFLESLKPLNIGRKGKLVPFNPYSARFNSVSFSPDEKLIVAANSDDNFVSVWNVDSRDELERLTRNLRQVWLAVFPPDDAHAERILVVGGEEAQLIDRDEAELIDRDEKAQIKLKKKPERTRFAPHGVVNSAHFDPAGTDWIVTAGTDKTARIWNSQSGTVHLKLESGTVKILNGKTGQEEELKLDGHTAAINSAVFSPDKKLVLTAGDDHNAKLWYLDWKDDGIHLTRVLNLGVQPEAEPKTTHSQEVSSAVFSKSGRWILTTSLDGTAKLFSSENPAQSVLPPLQYGDAGDAGVAVLCGAFSFDDKMSNQLYVALGGKDSRAKVWSVDFETKAVNEYLRLVGHTAEVTSIAFAPPIDRNGDGNNKTPSEDLNGDGNLDVNEDLNGNDVLDENEDVDGDGKLDTVDEDKNGNGVLDDAETRPRRILTGSADSIVKLWDARRPTDSDEKGQGEPGKGEQAKVQPAKQEQQRDAAGKVAPNAKRTIKFAEAKEILSLKGHTREITSVSFSDDGQYVLSSGNDGKAIVWLASPWVSKNPLNKQPKNVQKKVAAQAIQQKPTRP